MAASPPPSQGSKRGQKCYVAPAFSGVPNAKRGEKSRSGCLSPAFSGAQKMAEVVCNLCILGGPRKGFNKGPHRAGRHKPLRGVLKGNRGQKKGSQRTTLIRSGPQVGSVATIPLLSEGGLML